MNRYGIILCALVSLILLEGCDEFSVIKSEFSDFDNFRKTGDATGLDRFKVNSVILLPYLSQNPNEGYYDLQVAIWSEDQSKELKIDRLEIDGVESGKPKVPIVLRAGSHDERTGMFRDHETAIEMIPATDLLKFLRDGLDVEISVPVRAGEQKLKFELALVVEKHSAPIH